MNKQTYWTNNAWPYILGALIIFGLLTLDGLIVGDHINKVTGLLGCFAAVTVAVVCASHDEDVDRNRERYEEDQ